MNFISKILAPTDCSEASIDALKYSIKIAKTHRAELMVLYVVSSLSNVASHTLSDQSISNSKAHLATINQLNEYW